MKLTSLSLPSVLIGFDRMIDLANSLTTVPQPTYPPYNIVSTNDGNYRLELALAGFDSDSIQIEEKDSQLRIWAEKKSDSDETTVKFIHKGIASRSFDNTFHLGDYMKVTNAELKNGILTINIVKEVPEEMKPRRINIA